MKRRIGLLLEIITKILAGTFLYMMSIDAFIRISETYSISAFGLWILFLGVFCLTCWGFIAILDANVATFKEDKAPKP